MVDVFTPTSTSCRNITSNLKSWLNKTIYLIANTRENFYLHQAYNFIAESSKKLSEIALKFSNFEFYSTITSIREQRIEVIIHIAYFQDLEEIKFRLLIISR